MMYDAAYTKAVPDLSVSERLFTMEIARLELVTYTLRTYRSPN